MPVQLHVSTPLSDEDKEIMRAILGDAPPAAAPAKRTPRKTAVADAAPVADPDIATPDPGHAGEEPTTTTEALNDRDLMAEAVARATELVSAKKSDVVKDALAKVGVKRVSELKKDEDIEKFLAELP